MSNITHLAVFASGSGTNAEKIMEYFQDHPNIRVGLILSNKSDAGVLDRASRFKVPTIVVSRSDFENPDIIKTHLRSYNIGFIVLAGFLWLIPRHLTDTFSERIVNLHPSLLPKFGGKGMYGSRVHQAVIDSGEEESGITIHYVNEHYDEGNIIFQAKCDVFHNETPESLAQKIHHLEHQHFPKVIERVILGR